MQQKSFILERVGKKWNETTRIILVYEASLTSLENLGLAKSEYAKLKLAFFYNIGTGEIELKLNFDDSNIHSDNIEFTLSNGDKITPERTSVIKDNFDKPEWQDLNTMETCGYVYSINQTDLLKIANSTNLSGVIHAAFLKDIIFNVNDISFQQLKDLIIARFSTDESIITSLYDKYSKINIDSNNVSDGRKQEFKPATYGGGGCLSVFFVGLISLLILYFIK